VLRGLPFLVAGALLGASVRVPWDWGTFVDAAIGGSGQTGALWMSPTENPGGAWTLVVLYVVAAALALLAVVAAIRPVPARIVAPLVAAALVAVVARCLGLEETLGGGLFVALAALVLAAVAPRMPVRSGSPLVTAALLVSGTLLLAFVVGPNVDWEWLWLARIATYGGWTGALICLAAGAVLLAAVLPPTRWRALIPLGAAVVLLPAFVSDSLAEQIAVAGATSTAAFSIGAALAIALVALLLAPHERGVAWQRPALVAGALVLLVAPLVQWTRPDPDRDVLFGAIDKYTDAYRTGWQLVLDPTEGAAVDLGGPSIALAGTLVCLVALVALARRRGAGATL
jgi:hypothetical protein